LPGREQLQPGFRFVKATYFGQASLDLILASIALRG
jgi:hypothetical protein